ncbi:hypothetical protein NE237_003201 [Protea cynaroides]|uniref:Uncharacterized protein n=1 Tax=Protea cynaroides TaxID=273540 RepID=A0A9Q0KGJ2_9MAGN|nr:hypothetical protein NE237_003201 [Protea cynaroides]
MRKCRHTRSKEAFPFLLKAFLAIDDELYDDLGDDGEETKGVNVIRSLPLTETVEDDDCEDIKELGTIKVERIESRDEEIKEIVPEDSMDTNIICSRQQENIKHMLDLEKRPPRWRQRSIKGIGAAFKLIVDLRLKQIIVVDNDYDHWPWPFFALLFQAF